jgi:arginyl-tRNA synthetase
MEEAAREKAADTRTDNLEDLTQQVAVAALKYQILRQAVGSNIVFDKERALSFEGDSGPYLQYTYARILSVLEKAAAVGVVPSTKVIYPPISDVELLMYQFEEVVESAMLERAPHKVTGFLTELAGAFNSFYAHEKIADPDDEYAPYKAAIAQTVAITLKNGLWILGIQTPERL